MVNPRLTYVPLNALGGAYTPIVLTMMARYVEIAEDVAPGSPNGGVAQGFVGNLVDPITGELTPPVVGDGFWKQVDPAAEPQAVIKMGDPRGAQAGLGVPVGAMGATVAKLTSATATATQAIVREWF